MKKLILTDYEYDVLQRVLKAVPPAQLTRILPECNGADLRFYRDLLTKVLHENRRFPDTDDGLNEAPANPPSAGKIWDETERRWI